jgi:methanogenic corrinoid protein MtbC1
MIYMGLAFRPMIMPDGTIKRVGIQIGNDMCLDPEVYPNLLTAAPAMYQMLSILRDKEGSTPTREAIESVMAFAQQGYLLGHNVNEMIKKATK